MHASFFTLSRSIWLSLNLLVSLMLWTWMSWTIAPLCSLRHRAPPLVLILVWLAAKAEFATHWERRFALVLGNWERGWSWRLVTSGKVHVDLVLYWRGIGLVDEIVSRTKRKNATGETRTSCDGSFQDVRRGHDSSDSFWHTIWMLGCLFFTMMSWWENWILSAKDWQNLPTARWWFTKESDSEMITFDVS